MMIMMLQGNADGWIKLTLMLEEYLDGPEVDVDLVLSEGEAVYGAITDNWPTVEPYFNETGSNCPSILPTKQQQELMQMAVESTNCLGFKQVCCHMFCSWANTPMLCLLLVLSQPSKLLLWGCGCRGNLGSSNGRCNQQAAASSPHMHAKAARCNPDRVNNLKP